MWPEHEKCIIRKEVSAYETENLFRKGRESLLGPLPNVLGSYRLAWNSIIHSSSSGLKACHHFWQDLANNLFCSRCFLALILCNFLCFMVGDTGIEPVTSCMSSRGNIFSLFITTHCITITTPCGLCIYKFLSCCQEFTRVS